jgi:prolyl oligopeptidase
MKYLFYILFILVFVACGNQKESKSSLKYPETAKVDTADEYFGVKINDPYRWLEDDMSEATASWVQAQNKVTNSYLAAIPYKNEVEKRIETLINYERYSSPSKEGDWYYFFKNDGLQNQNVLYRQESLDGEEELFLDPNTFSEDGTIALNATGFSSEGKYFAYSVSVSGSDWNEIYVMNTETKEKLSDKVEWVKFSGINWYDDGFFYTRFPEPEEGEELSGVNKFAKVCYHKVGTSQSEDKVVVSNPEDGDEYYGVSITEDERFLIVSGI